MTMKYVMKSISLNQSYFQLKLFLAKGFYPNQVILVSVTNHVTEKNSFVQNSEKVATKEARK